MPVLVALGSFVTTLLGGVAALRIGDRRHLVLGLAAGLMLGVVLFDLLPEALGEQPEYLFGVPVVLLATMAGFLALHVIERSALVHRGHEAEYADHQHHPGVGMLAAAGLVGHSLMDGFAIGAAFQAGSTVAAVVAIGRTCALGPAVGSDILCAPTSPAALTVVCAVTCRIACISR